MGKLDFTFSADPLIIVLTPFSDAAEAWCEENLPEDCPRRDGGYAIERNYFLPIYEGIENAGFTIEHSYVR